MYSFNLFIITSLAMNIEELVLKELGFNDKKDNIYHSIYNQHSQSLKIPQMSEMLISFPPLFKTLDDIKEINANYNDFAIIVNLPLNLKSLLMDSNCIKQIDNDNINDKLETLSCNNNKINYVQLDKTTIKSVYLQSNQIDDTFDVKYLPLTLKDLNLSKNKLSKFLNFSLHVNLSDVNLSNNMLTQMPEFPFSIKYVNVSGNQIDDIKTLKKLSNLQVLNVTNNNIKSLDNLPDNIVELYASGNPIESVECLCNKMHLQTVYCSAAQIKKINKFPENVELYVCNNNPIKSLNLNMIRNDKAQIKCTNDTLEYIYPLNKVDRVTVGREDEQCNKSNKLLKLGAILIIQRYWHRYKARKQHRTCIIV